MRRTCFAASVALLVVVGGCSSPRSGAYLDPALDARMLQTAPVTWLGVCALAGPDDDDARVRYRDAAHAAAIDARPRIGWVEPSLAWIGLGPQEALDLLDTYRAVGRFTADQLGRLAVIGDRARYVMVGRIDLDLTSLDYDRQEREVSGRWTLTVEPRTRREMSATFDLFDLGLRSLVFSITLQRTEYERGNPIEVEMFESAPTEADFERTVRDLLARETMPDPPERSKVLGILAREAVRALPSAAGGR
jgi:hypothetical protein